MSQKASNIQILVSPKMRLKDFELNFFSFLWGGPFILLLELKSLWALGGIADVRDGGLGS